MSMGLLGRRSSIRIVKWSRDIVKKGRFWGRKCRHSGWLPGAFFEGNFTRGINYKNVHAIVCVHRKSVAARCEVARWLILVMAYNLNTAPFRASYLTKIGKYFSRYFLSNQWEYRESLKHFCSPSSVDWQMQFVWLYVGRWRQVIQFRKLY